MKSLISAAQGPEISVVVGAVAVAAAVAVVAGVAAVGLLELPLNIPVRALPAT